MQTSSQRRLALTRLLVVLAALLALGQFQGAPTGPSTTHELVAGPVSASTATVARLARHVPNPAPTPQLHAVVWAGCAVLLLLVCVGVAARSPSRRTRQAYLLPFAGRGPPATS